MAIFYQATAWKRWALFLLTFPLVFVSEIGRNLLAWRLILSGKREWAWELFDELGVLFHGVVLIGFSLVAAWVMNRIRVSQWLRRGI